MDLGSLQHPFAGCELELLIAGYVVRILVEVNADGPQSLLVTCDDDALRLSPTPEGMAVECLPPEEEIIRPQDVIMDRATIGWIRDTAAVNDARMTMFFKTGTALLPPIWKRVASVWRSSRFFRRRARLDWGDEWDD